MAAAFSPRVSSSRCGRAEARAATAAEGWALRREFRIQRPDGVLRWLAVTAQVYFEGEPPRASRLIGAAIDITERKDAETVLREREEGARIGLEAGRMGTWRYDLLTGAQQWDRQ